MADDLTLMERRGFLQTARLADTLQAGNGVGDAELLDMLTRRLKALSARVGGGHVPEDEAEPHVRCRCGERFDSWSGFAAHLMPGRYEAGFYEDADGDYWLKTVDGEWLYADMLWGDSFETAPLMASGGLDPESLALDRIAPADLVCIDSDGE